MLPPTSDDEVGFAFDPGVEWSVIDLDQADVDADVRAQGYIEIWATPGAVERSLQGELGSMERLIAAGLETVEVDGISWRQVHAFGEGWVKDQFLVANRR